jgi:hypothetical protein
MEIEKKELSEEQKASRRQSRKKWIANNKEIYNAKSNEYTKAWYQRNKQTVLAKKKEQYVAKKSEAKTIVDACKEFGCL